MNKSWQINTLLDLPFCVIYNRNSSCQSHFNITDFKSSLHYSYLSHHTVHHPCILLMWSIVMSPYINSVWFKSSYSLSWDRGATAVSAEASVYVNLPSLSFFLMWSLLMTFLATLLRSDKQVKRTVIRKWIAWLIKFYSLEDGALIFHLPLLETIVTGNFQRFASSHLQFVILFFSLTLFPLTVYTVFSEK